MATYQALIDRYPDLAEAHYRLGRQLQRVGRIDEANRHFVIARDCDGNPMRCPTAFQDVYRAIAAEFDAVLIDGPEVLRRVSPSRVLDYEVFHDQHHPTIRGHAALAEAVLKGLWRRGALGWPRNSPPPVVTPAECVRQFRINNSALIGACAWAINAHRYTAKHRYDPSERLAWADRFERAAERLRNGEPPERLCLPGFSVPGERRRRGTSLPEALGESKVTHQEQACRPGRHGGPAGSDPRCCLFERQQETP